MSIDLANYIKAGESFLLVGPPGIGKTARIHEAARKAGREVIVMRASLSERVDFGGALVPDQAGGVTRALPLELLHRLQTTETPTLLFLDDLGQAPIDVQAACMRLFDTGFLSDKVLICGATNRPGDKAGVSALCEPLRSRFAMAFTIATPKGDEGSRDTVKLSPWYDFKNNTGELNDWLNWAMSIKAPPEIIAFHRKTSGNKLYAWEPNADPSIRMADYRSWHTVIRLWHSGIRDEGSISAVIGRGVASEFLSFCALANDLPGPDEIFKDPEGARLPQDAGQMYLVSCSIAAACTKDTVSAMLTYANRLDRMYAILAVRDAFMRHKESIVTNPDFRKFMEKNDEVFRLGCKS